MNKKLIGILVVAVIAAGILLFAMNPKLIQNQGEVKSEVRTPLPKYEGSQVDSVIPYDPAQPYSPARGAQMNPVKQNMDVLPYPQISNNYAPQDANIAGQFGVDAGKQPKMDCFPKDVVTPQELMPRDDSYNTWQMTSPAVNGHLADRNFLESGHHFGIDTVSNTLKNANYQIRSDPIIPQIQVGPWMQSTWGPDTNHRQFEIGGDY